MGKQLYRSAENKIIAGVCGGIAEYFSIDPTIIRIAWVAISLSYGFGILAYIIAAVIMPIKQYHEEADVEADEYPPDSREFVNDKKGYDSKRTSMILGAGLIILGVMLFVKETFGWIDWINFKTLWPVAIILIGVAVIFKMGKSEK